MTEHPNIPPQVHPSRLANLLGCSDANSQVWDDSELQSVLEHQWGASVAETLRRPDLPAGTFGELFALGEPSLSVLKAVHEYAKAAGRSAESHLPPDVARLLYFATIFMARSRCGADISRMSADELDRAAVWVESRPWAPAAIGRALAALIPRKK